MKLIALALAFALSAPIRLFVVALSWLAMVPIGILHLVRRRPELVAALLLAVASGPAFAADDTTVQFAPWVAFLKPYLDALVQALIMFVVIPLVSYAIYRLTGIQIDKRYSDQLTKLLTNGAAGLVATGAAKIGTAGVDVHSPSLKTAADKIIAFAPNAIAHFGLTPQDVADRIVQKIPQLPATAATTAPTTGA